MPRLAALRERGLVAMAEGEVLPAVQDAQKVLAPQESRGAPVGEARDEVAWCHRVDLSDAWERAQKDRGGKHCHPLRACAIRDAEPAGQAAELRDAPEPQGQQVLEPELRDGTARTAAASPPVNLFACEADGQLRREKAAAVASSRRAPREDSAAARDCNCFSVRIHSCALRRAPDLRA